MKLPDGKIAEDGTLSVLATSHKLKLNDVLVPATFSLNGEHILADPTAEEENLQSGYLTVVLANNKCAALLKPAGTPLSIERIGTCVEIARQRRKKIVALLEKASE